MSKPSKQAAPASSSPLTTAASALDLELRRYFDLTAAAQKIPITSEKNLERAARAVQDAAASQERVAAHVRALFEAITTAREAQEASALALAKHAEHMATRATELGELLQKFAELGVEAKALNAMMQEAAGYKKDPYAADDGEAKKRIEQVYARMEQVAQNAQALAELAGAKGIEDVARQADSVRQQIHAAKNKLTLLQKSLAKS
jgi:hypothetical protein